MCMRKLSSCQDKKASIGRILKTKSSKAAIPYWAENDAACPSRQLIFSNQPNFHHQNHHDLEWQRWQKNPYWHLCIITREEPNLCFWLSQCLVCQSNKASYTFTNFCVSQYGLQELELHHHTYDHKYKCQRAKEGSKKRRRFFRLSSIQRGVRAFLAEPCMYYIIRRQ